jgi:hypothetical protein
LRVDWAILCRYVEVINGLATIVGGGIDRYGPMPLPQPLVITAAVRLVGLPDMADHTIEVQVLDPLLAPVGQPVPPATFKMQAPGPDHPPGWEANVLVPMIVNIEVADAGTYTLDIKVDGHSHTHPFRVLNI